MFIVYFVLWVILNGKWTTEIGVIGAVLSAAVYAFSCRFMGYSFRKDIKLLSRIAAAIRYCVMLLWEIVKANLTVLKMTFDLRFEPKPQLVSFHSGLRFERHRAVLANSITLTPGTITCQLEDDLFVVHCLDESLAEGLNDGAMVEALKKLEEEA